MNAEIRHNPGFAVTRCTLAGGEKMRAESGSMAATSAGVEIEAKVQGGLMKGLKRSVLGGESLFMTTLTAPSGGGWVDVAANLPGDAMVMPVGEELFLTRGAYLASDANVDIDTKWGGFKSIGGGEEFVMEFTGPGVIHTQTRNPDFLVTWLTEVLPFTRA